MRLKAVNVKMYRPIIDSGWIDIDDITVIVGKNESGKSALLKALHKFKSFTPEPYTLEREWPRGHRRERSPDAVVVQTRFDFEGGELDEIAELIPSGEKPTGVEISKTYEGEYKYKFLPSDLDYIEQTTKGSILSQLDELSVGDLASENLKQVVSQMRSEALRLVESSGLAAFTENIATYKNQINTAVQLDKDHDRTYAHDIVNLLDNLSSHVDVTSRKQIESKVFEWIPTFIYMDDHKPFHGSAYLDQIKLRKDSGLLTDEDKTFLIIFEMAGLNFDEELQRSNDEDREQRMLDMNDASLTLTHMLADHWSQRNYKINFVADGYHVITFVSDDIQTSLVSLDERSKGFQWFFSFDTTFLYETQGTFKNAIILLDEPGLHLHASAQRDFLLRLKDYAKDNQLIYTTHMPFMIDMQRLDNIRVCTESTDQGSTVSADFYVADEQARFSLQAALGLSISQDLFTSPYNLVVEGVTDFWLLSTMARILRDENRTSLDERVEITPSGTATTAAYVATMLQGRDLNVVVLLESDPEGEKVAEGLIKKWIMEDRHVLLLGKALGREEDITLEDLFSDWFYLSFFNKAYDKELKGKPLTVEEVNANGKGQPQLIQRIESALRSRSMESDSEGWAFSKGRVAKLLMTELPKQSLEDLPYEMVEDFERLFKSINEVMPGLNDAPDSEKATKSPENASVSSKPTLPPEQPSP